MLASVDNHRGDLGKVPRVLMGNQVMDSGGNLVARLVEAHDTVEAGEEHLVVEEHLLYEEVLQVV